MGLISKIFGTYSEREVKRVMPLVNKINELEQEIEKLTDTELKAKTVEFKERLAKGQTKDDILVEAFAAIREAAKRVLGEEVAYIDLNTSHNFVDKIKRVFGFGN